MATISNLSTPYLRSPAFDSFFVIFIPLLAITVACLVVVYPMYFELALTLNLALLGYHHVISTYTRIAASWQDFRENYFLAFYLPFIVFGMVTVLALIGSTWLIATIYLHWQWWHYTRQSDGIAKAIRYRSGSKESEPFAYFNRVVFYLGPVFCFLLMSSKQPDNYLYMQVYTLPVPRSFIWAIGAIFFCGFITWNLIQLKAFFTKNITLHYFLYLILHHAIYIISYVLIDDVTTGWLCINIWHNLQYVVFVWHFNTTRFKGGEVDGKKLLSWVSQPRRIFIYFGICLAVTFVFYGGVNVGVDFFSSYTALPLAIIFYMTINFHHYVVDTYIWKLRTSTVRKSIGLDA